MQTFEMSFDENTEHVIRNNHTHTATATVRIHFISHAKWMRIIIYYFHRAKHSYNHIYILHATSHQHRGIAFIREMFEQQPFAVRITWLHSNMIYAFNHLSEFRQNERVDVQT